MPYSITYPDGVNRSSKTCVRTATRAALNEGAPNILERRNIFKVELSLKG